MIAFLLNLTRKRNAFICAEFYGDSNRAKMNEINSNNPQINKNTFSRQKIHKEAKPFLSLPNHHQKGKKITSVMLSVQLRASPLKPPRYHTAVMCEGFQGTLKLMPMMPRSTSPSDGCTPDRCKNSAISDC